MTSLLETTSQRLLVALQSLPGAGRPHPSRVGIVPDGERGPTLHVHTVSGARFRAWLTDDAPSLTALAQAVRPHLASLRHEPFDLYTVAGPGFAGLEIRSLAGISLLEVAVRIEGQGVRARVHQDDEARWQAEDEGRIGEDFQDFAERNALWTGLGGARPGGWELVVVEPDDPLPDLISDDGD